MVVQTRDPRTVKPGAVGRGICAPGKIMGANSHSWQTYGSNPCFIQIFDGPRIKSLESYLRQGYGSTSAELWVLSQDAKTVDRWTLQEGSGWRGRKSIPCPNFGSKVNLRPKVLLIKAPDGTVVHEEDLRGVGLAEPVVIFDLISGDGSMQVISSILPGRKYWWAAR